MPAVTNEKKSDLDAQTAEEAYLKAKSRVREVDSWEVKWVVNKVRSAISDAAYRQKYHGKVAATNQLDPLTIAEINRGQEPIYVRPPSLNFKSKYSFSAFGRRLDFIKEHERYFFGRNMSHDPYLIRGELSREIAKQLMDRCLSGDLKYYQKTTRTKLEISETKVDVRFEKRRPSSIKPAKVSEALLYGQFISDERNLVYLMAEFYMQHVEPHLKPENHQSPLSWAKAAMEIVHGYGEEIGSSDYIPRSSEIPYENAARIVGNTVPSNYRLNRTYKLSPELHQILSILNETCENLAPEIVAVICEHEAAVIAGALSDPAVLRFIENAKVIFDHGFLVERFAEYCHALEQSGLSPHESFIHAATVVSSIYSSQDKPWWFKEDFSLATGLKSGLSIEEIESVASSHSYHFPEIINAIANCPKDLLAALPFNTHEKLDFLCEISIHFGIGTPQRVSNILEYAAALFKEIPAKELSTAKEEFLTCLASRYPSSVINSMMEGDSVNFQKPGIIFMILARFGENYLKEHKIDSHTIKADAISGLAPLLTDHQKRQGLPLLIPGRPSHAVELITEFRALSSPSTPPLLAAPNEILSASAPLRYLCRFNNQLEQECSHLSSIGRDALARIYFIFIANKFPDPLAPPPGFLRFLSIFKETPLEGHKFCIAIEEHEIKETHEKNQELSIGKYIVITTLLDLYNFQLLSTAELSKICAWLTGDISDELRQKIERTHSYKTNRELQRNRAWENELYCLQEHTFTLKKNLADCIENNRRIDIRTFLNGDMPDGLKVRGIEIYSARLAKINEDTRYQDIKEDVGYENSRTFEYYMEPEYRSSFREDPDQRLVEQVRQDIGTATTKLRQHRLRHLQDFFQACSLHTSLLHLGLTTPTEAHEKVKHDLTGLLEEQDFHPTERNDILSGNLEGYCSYDEVKSETKTSKGHIAVSIFFLIKDGIFSKEQVREYYLAAENPAQLIELQQVLTTARNAFKTRLGEVESFFHTIDCDREGDQELLAKAKYLIGQLANVPIEHPIINRAAVEERIIFFAKSFPSISLSRRLTVASKIIGLNQTLATNEDSLSQEVVASNQRLLVTWGAAVTSEALTKELETLREQSPKPVGPDSNLQFVERLMQLPDLLPIVQRTFTPQLISEFKDQILEYRRNTFGMLAVGAKIHFLNPVDEQRLAIYIKKLQLDQTSFRLIHAGTSLIIKPMATAEELELIIYFLNREGLIDLEYPEIQITAPGRLPLEDAALLGSFTILASDLGVRYNADSFKTGAHDTEVGYRIMTYDAGAARIPMVFDTNLRGRTDILGRRSTKDIATYQLISTILVHGRENAGIFQELCEPFKRDWQAVMESHGLGDVLKTDWLWTRASSPKRGSAEKHYQEAVKPCTDAWFDCVEEAERVQSDSVGIVKAAEILLDSYRNRARILSQQALENPSYQRERELLLSL